MTNAKILAGVDQCNNSFSTSGHNIALSDIQEKLFTDEKEYPNPAPAECNSEPIGKPFSAHRIKKLQDLRAHNADPSRPLERSRGVWVRSLLASENVEPYTLPKLWQEPTITRLGALLAGWVAMAWVCQRKPLYGSHRELAKLCRCSVGSVERWMKLLATWGWVLPKSHYKPRAGGGWTQQANSYAPGLLMRMAINHRRQREQLNKRPGPKPLGPVVSALRAETKQLPASARTIALARVKGVPDHGPVQHPAPHGRLTSGASVPAMRQLELAARAAGEAGEGKGCAPPAVAGDLETERLSAPARAGDVFDDGEEVRAWLEQPAPKRGLRAERAEQLAALAELPAEEVRAAALALCRSFAGGDS